jgi:TolB-like protein/Flp pilus assembly protein TadD
LDSHLQDGLRIGNFFVAPLQGAVTGARGTHRLSKDRIELLVALAARPGEPIAFDELADIVDCDPEELAGHIEAIRAVLGDTGPHRRVVVVDDGAVTLIAPVRAGTGRSHGHFDESDDDADISFFKQLQRRNVIRVGAGYMLLAWVVIQVADTVMPALDMPAWAVTLTIGTVILGFPVALVVAWLFETTSVGILWDERRVPAAVTRTQKLIDISVLSALAITAGYFALGVLTDVKNSRDRDAVLLSPSHVIGAANTLAVIPFRQLGANGDYAYIGDGIAEEILRILSRLGELNVAARAASFYFKDKDVALETMAQRLKVRHVLSGSIQVSGDSIRIYAELVDAVTGYQIWADSFDRQMGDLLAIQSEIARAVADRSTEVLSGSSKATLNYRPTKSPEAYDYYLRGRDYLRRPRTEDVLENAERLFHRALAVDPGYTLALAGLCETHLAVYIRTRSVATIDDAETVCRSALEIDSSLPEVHTALGYLYWHTGDFDRAESEFGTAIDKDPNYYEAFAGLGDTLFSKNQLIEAQLTYQQLVNLQPAYWRGYQRIGAYYYRQGKDKEAIPFFEQVTDLAPDNALGWNNLGAVNYMLGNFEAAANAYRRGIEIAPTQAMYSNLGTMYYYFGRFEDSVEMLQEAIDIAPDDFRSWGRLAAAYVQMAGRSVQAASAYDQGISLATKIIEINPNESDAYKNIALFYAHTNSGGLAEVAIEKAIGLTPNDPDTHFFAALTYLALDDAERCMVLLERAVALGYSKNLIASEPALMELRDSERFKVLISANDFGV